MAPPELPRDTPAIGTYQGNVFSALAIIRAKFLLSPANVPIMNVGEPVLPDFVKTWRNNLDVAIFNRFEGLCTHAFGLYEPLATNKRFDDLAATLGPRYTLCMRLDL